ncbi:MAG: lysophospholipase [Actinomycetes bacterium]
MTAYTSELFDGARGRIAVRRWRNPGARHLVALVHGYGEHMGRYVHVADTLVARGAEVFGPDHLGHGQSAGERVLIADFDDVLDDLHRAVESVRKERPGLPLVVVGHSLGGMIATRYAQTRGHEMAGLVLSGPVLGSWVQATSLLEQQEIPDTPIDVSTLSRDPRVGAAYAADPLVWHGPFRRETLRAIERCLADINAGPTVGELPTLWLHGEADALVPIAPSREGVDRIAGSDLVERTYPDARHEIFNETNRDEVLAELADFVDRVTAR